MVRTVISRDKGAVWGYLAPPTVDSLGDPIPCAQVRAAPRHRNAPLRTIDN